MGIANVLVQVAVVGHVVLHVFELAPVQNVILTVLLAINFQLITAK